MDTTRVFSYRRFSSGRQAFGHSLERQVEGARRWCQENGYTLDESLALADLGVSAYKGDNVSRGALSGFLTAIEARKVPSGSILLVESLDRLSRAAIPEAVGLLTSIVRAGVRVVSLIDGKEWNNTTIEDSTSFLLSVILFSRAHEESSTKARRVSEAFQRKRSASLPVVSIMHGPGWINPRADGTGWELDNEKATIVERVFSLAAAGHGGIAIARHANQEGWPLPWRKRKNSSKGWEHTAISRLLRDRRALGEWQPQRMVAGRLVPDGDPVQNYYPAVIANDLWHKVQAALTGRAGPKRLRGLKADVFAGLLYCACGDRMDRKAPSTRGSARYYCVARNAGRTTCPPVAERILVERVLSFIAQMQQEVFRSDDKAEALRNEIAITEAKALDARERADKLLLAIEQAGHSTMLLQRLRAVEDELVRFDEKVESAREALVAIPLLDRTFGAEFAGKVAEIVADKSKVEERHKLASALTSAFERIVWNGRNFMVYARSGVGFAVILPKELLGRAKRRDAGKKRTCEGQ